MPWELARFMLVNSVRCLVSITFIEGIKQVDEISSRAGERSSLAVDLKATCAGMYQCGPCYSLGLSRCVGAYLKLSPCSPTFYTFILHESMCFRTVYTLGLGLKCNLDSDSSVIVVVQHVA